MGRGTGHKAEGKRSSGGQTILRTANTALGHRDAKHKAIAAVWGQGHKGQGRHSGGRDTMVPTPPQSTVIPCPPSPPPVPCCPMALLTLQLITDRLPAVEQMPMYTKMFVVPCLGDTQYIK